MPTTPALCELEPSLGYMPFWDSLVYTQRLSLKPNVLHPKDYIMKGLSFPSPHQGHQVPSLLDPHTNLYHSL